MTLRELIIEVRDVLQDADGVYFTDSELVNTYNECKRLITFDRKDKVSEVTVDTLDGTYSYATTDFI